MPAQRVFALPRQQSLLLPAVLNPFALEARLTRREKIKVSTGSVCWAGVGSTHLQLSADIPAGMEGSAGRMCPRLVDSEEVT